MRWFILIPSIIYDKRKSIGASEVFQVTAMANNNKMAVSSRQEQKKSNKLANSGSDNFVGHFINKIMPK